MLELYFNKTMRLLVVSLLCFLGVDAQTDKTTHIFQGTDAKPDDFPYMVAITYTGRRPAFYPGVIVSSTWVLALGDKVFKSGDGDMGNLTIGAGSNGGTKFQVDKIVKKPGFEYHLQRYNYNFYLLKIKDGEFFTGISYASLVSTKLSKDAKVVAVSLENPTTKSLRRGDMKWMDLEDCKKVYGTVVTYQLDGNIGCADTSGTSALCSADVGAAFFENNVLRGFLARVVAEKACSVDAAPVLLAECDSSVSEWVQKIIDT